MNKQTQFTDQIPCVGQKLCKISGNLHRKPTTHTTGRCLPRPSFGCTEPFVRPLWRRHPWRQPLSCTDAGQHARTTHQLPHTQQAKQEVDGEAIWQGNQLARVNGQQRNRCSGPLQHAPGKQAPPVLFTPLLWDGDWNVVGGSQISEHAIKKFKPDHWLYDWIPLIATKFHRLALQPII